MKSPTISIIIPAYNAQHDLERCLDSILEQKMTDYEVILVDDGSTDRTAEIAMAYAQRDPRFKVFQQKNRGVSAARNHALDEASGEWITFIDADDRIEGDYFPLTFDAKIDMYVQNWRFGGDDHFTEHLDSMTVSEENYVPFLQSYAHLDLFRATWCKFIKRGIIEANHIRFIPGIRIGEDCLFFMEYQSHCKSVEILDSGIYVYYRQEGDWIQKYNLSIDEVTHYFRDFLIRSTLLPADLPKLTSFIYWFYSGLLKKEDQKKLKWILNPTVIKIKEKLDNTSPGYRARLKLMKVGAFFYNIFSTSA